MIPAPSGVRVWLATGHTDMRRGVDGLALQVLEAHPDGRDRAAIVDQLCGEADARGIRILRDKDAVGLGARISKFMNQGLCVAVRHFWQAGCAALPANERI
ncbi:MAG: hypothetical protein IPM60_17640 [Rhodospirillales bacterium]|nr:hypothetical protein [Rhodospirillales bacterium]